MNSWLKLLLIYGAVLGLSHATVAWLLDSPTRSEEKIMVWKSSGSSDTEDDIPIILFHGIQGPEDSLQVLAQKFVAKNRTVILPNLYAFGVPKQDLSLSDRALLFSNQWFAKDPRPVHLIGYTLGGAAAVEVAAKFPERIQSLTLVSASLTQPFEMLGDYSLNRALYSLQAGTFWFIDHLIPHFGAIRWFPAKYIHLKTWAETDLRGMGTKLRSLPMPALVIHGANDFLVPPEAAQHHHTLIPRSHLLLTDSDHGINATRSESLLQNISEFISTIEAGTFIPEEASPDEEFNFTLSGKRFWWIVAIIFVGTKVSEDLATVAAGLLVSQGVFPMWTAILVCFLGIMIGDTALYFFGRFAGIGILRKRPFSWILKEQNVLDAEDWFQKRGLAVVVISRFVPATRLPVYVATGILGVPPLKFIGVLSLAALIWTPLIIGLTTLLGKPLLAFIETYEQWALSILVAFFLALTILLKFILPLATRRGRRLLYRRWVRLRNFGNRSIN